MALTISGDVITSDQTAHTARAVPGDQRQWEVSWLPGRRLDRNSAITAMTLAELAGPGGMHPGHRLWGHAEGWAAELGLTGPTALAQAARPPARADDGKTAGPADPEAGG